MAVGYFLLLLMFQVTAAQVLPPTNVTLQCQNMKNTLKWSYEQLSPELKFKVVIGSKGGSFDASRSPLWVDSPSLEADVSFLSDRNDEYFLTVSAVIGENTSEPVPPDGITFSYFQGALVDQKCSLDLPPVNVTVESEDKVVLRFLHPWLFYEQNLGAISTPKPLMKKKKKRHDTDIFEDLPEFKYQVMVNKQEHGYSCWDRICMNTVPVDATQEKHCLKIKGEMDKMHVQGTQEYCVRPFKEAVDQNLGKTLYIGLGILILTAFAFILFLVYRKKTISTTPLPPSMKIMGSVRQWTMGNVQEQVVVPQVEPSSPTPLLQEKEVDELPPASTPFNEYDLRMPIGVSTENEREEVCDVTVAEKEKDDYMPGANLDEDEESNSFEAHSSYEKRQVVVEIAPGEKAEGYRG